MPRKNQALDGVNERFLEAMNNIIAKRTTEVTNISQFAESLGSNASAITQIKNPAYQRSVSLQMLTKLCERYDVNGHWLLTGKGTMFGEEEKDMLKTIMNRLEVLEKKVGD